MIDQVITYTPKVTIIFHPKKTKGKILFRILPQDIPELIKHLQARIGIFPDHANKDIGTKNED